MRFFGRLALIAELGVRRPRLGCVRAVRHGIHPGNRACVRQLETWESPVGSPASRSTSGLDGIPHAGMPSESVTALPSLGQPGSQDGWYGRVPNRTLREQRRAVRTEGIWSLLPENASSNDRPRIHQTITSSYQYEPSSGRLDPKPSPEQTHRTMGSSSPGSNRGLRCQGDGVYRQHAEYANAARRLAPGLRHQCPP